jgi:hypothetical protein
MANKIIAPDDAARGLLKICREQIKEMEREGLSKKEIHTILSAIFSGFMHSPYWDGYGDK